MRQLKDIKSFEEINIENDINDMFIEITDLDREMIIDIDFYTTEIEVVISRTRLQGIVINDDIKDVMLRIYQYMREKKYYSNIEVEYFEYYENPKPIIIRPDDKIMVKSRGSWVIIDFYNIVYSISMCFYTTLKEKEKRYIK